MNKGVLILISKLDEGGEGEYEYEKPYDRLLSTRSVKHCVYHDQNQGQVTGCFMLTTDKVYNLVRRLERWLKSLMLRIHRAIVMKTSKELDPYIAI